MPARAIDTCVSERKTAKARMAMAELGKRSSSCAQR